MVNGLISVIVPVYNVEKYLHKCIESIIGQTYKNLEIILVDDGSTDSSGSICDDYAKKDNRIKVFHKENGGQASARNFALEIAKGEFVGFVDSDDWIEPEMYEILYKALIENDADISMCGRTNMSEDYEVINHLFTFDKGFVFSKEEAIKRFLLFDGIDSSSCDKLFKIKIAKNNQYPCGYICEDLPYIFNCIKESSKIYHVGRSLYNYIQRNNSTSHSSYSKKTEGLYIYPKQICDSVKQEYPQLKAEAEYYQYYLQFAYYKLLNKAVVKDKKGREITLEDLMQILKNKYLNKQIKGMYVLYKYKIYKPLKRIKGIFR